MINNPLTYAEQIIAASKRMKSARDPDSAIAALDAFNALLEDHDMIHLMASTYQLLATIFLDETAPQQSRPTRIEE